MCCFMDKLISVVIPTYNRKELTDSAVQSVVSSSQDLLEIIVVDDCGDVAYSFDSAVNSSGILVRVVRLQKNIGAGMARKAGVEEARGKFIAFLDSDDCYDIGWMDYVATMLQTNPTSQNYRVMISGITDGERRVGAVTRRILATIPTPLQSAASRLVATMFNPFYTPSIVLHRDLCFFKDGLRHCEDYYSTAVALFRTDEILLPQVVACHLGRAPNSTGGESAVKEEMYKGEMSVRRAMLTSKDVTFLYKLLVPIGMLYQLVRTTAKILIGRLLAFGLLKNM